MGRRSRWDYLRQIHSRYRRAVRKTKGRILDEFCKVADYNRKYALRLLNALPPERHPQKRRPRSPSYSARTITLLMLIWEAAGYPWSVRLKALLPVWMPWARKRFAISSASEKQLLSNSLTVCCDDGPRRPSSPPRRSRGTPARRNRSRSRSAPATSTPASRRLWIRANFTLIEGQTQEMRNCALAVQKERSLGLSHRDIRILEGQDRKPWATRFLTILNAFALATGSTHRPTNDISTMDWADFESAAAIRNRLAHPEALTDLEVTREDVEVAMRAFRWYRETWQALLATVTTD